jgi:hypothetical protein
VEGARSSDMKMNNIFIEEKPKCRCVDKELIIYDERPAFNIFYESSNQSDIPIIYYFYFPHHTGRFITQNYFSETANRF